MEILRDYADAFIYHVNTNEIAIMLRCEGLLKDSDLIVIRSQTSLLDKTKMLLKTLYIEKCYKATALFFRFLQREYEDVFSTIPGLIGGKHTSIIISTSITLNVMCIDGDVSIDLTDTQVRYTIYP